MSHCPHCWTGTCQKHALQDHGKSKIDLDKPKETLNKMYDMMVGAKLLQLKKEADAEKAQVSNEYRESIEKNRKKTIQKNRSKKGGAFGSSGLNPQALAAINDYSTDNSSSSSSIEESKRHKKSRKSDKKSKKKDRKDRKKKKRKRSLDGDNSHDDEFNKEKKSKRHRHSTYKSGYDSDRNNNKQRR